MAIRGLRVGSRASATVRSGKRKLAARSGTVGKRGKVVLTVKVAPAKLERVERLTIVVTYVTAGGPARPAARTIEVRG